MSTSTKKSLAVQTMALNLESLLESGVPATSQIVNKGISYLLLEIPKLLYGKTSLEEISQPFRTLETYSEEMFGKKYDFKLFKIRKNDEHKKQGSLRTFEQPLHWKDQKIHLEREF